jgi:glycosyltransferase involved in cell wall biosynthesis
LERGLTSEDSEPKVFYDLKIEVIIPTLNEEATIREMIQGVHSTFIPISILVIDGGSTDATFEICKSEKVRFMCQRGKGKGSAMREAVENSEADIVVFIDGDGTYSPSDLELLLEPLLSGKSDMVIGSRILGKSEKGAVSTFNMVGNRLFNRMINFAMKSKITDSLSGYRALYRKTFKDLILFSDSFDIEVEMTVEALAKGYRVRELPIRYGLRKGSKTKLDPIDDGIKIARTLLLLLVSVNPLKFFGVVSLVFLAAAIYPTAQVLFEKISYGHITSVPAAVLASLFFVSSALSLVVGAVSELIVRSRRRLEYMINRKYEG